MEQAKKSPLIIVDASGFIYRGYYTQPTLTSYNDQPIGAVHGFTNMLIKLLNNFSPKKIIIVFDGGGKNFRHELYHLYKSNRPPLPEALITQFPIVREATQAFNLKMLEQKNIEADDIIATLVHKFRNENNSIIVVSVDKDLMQLIDKKTSVFDPVNEKFFDSDAVENKFGIKPEQLRDFLAIVGDRADYIPGIPGIGPKGAIALLSQFYNLESIIANADQIFSERNKKLVKKYTNEVLLSQKLVSLKTDIKFDITEDQLLWLGPIQEQLNSFLLKYNFQSLLPRVQKIFNFKNIKQDIDTNLVFIDTIQVLQEVIEDSKYSGYISIIYIISQKKLTLIALSNDSKKYYFINISNESNNEQANIFTIEKYESWWVEPILKLLSDSSILKITHNLKDLYHILDKYTSNVIINAVEDVVLMYYALITGKQYDIVNIIINLIGSEKILSSNTTKQIGNISQYIYQAYLLLKQQLFQNKVLYLYYEVDLPLAHILYKVEKQGVKVDSQILVTMRAEIQKEIPKLEHEIFKICGKEFNLASPKQLSEVLFEWLKLPNAKNNKSLSTRAEVLENLNNLGFAGADLILRWRHLHKLKTTYIDGILEQINPLTNKVYTTFNSANTLTGRLSSSNPNLQNIPIRGVESHQIRSAFISPKGYTLISADYSQIELRILSHIANIDTLITAFKNGRDIHIETACQIFNLHPEEITQDHRRKAKVINFGVIYGISSFGLSKHLNIPVHQAKKYIEQYFYKYPGIKEYITSTKKFAIQHNYVVTHLGRRCYINNINSNDANLRHFAERVAINAPIQGSAADVMRLAMIAISNKLLQSKSQSNIILQIHDEVVLEVPIEEITLVTNILKISMENAISLQVPLTADIKVGTNLETLT